MTRPSVFVCPSDMSESHTGPPEAPEIVAATSSYATCAGSIGPTYPAGQSFTQSKFENNGMFFYHRSLRAAHIRDGLSNTMFAGEPIGAE
jgi:hypothetical protein